MSLLSQNIPYLNLLFFIRKYDNDILVNGNPISVRLESEQQRINTATFYLRHISTPLVGVVFKHR